MFIKTKVRDLLELLGRNTVAEVQALFLKSGRSWDISKWDDDRLYELFKQRSDNNSTIFVGQYPVDERHNRLRGGFHHGQNLSIMLMKSP